MRRAPGFKLYGVGLCLHQFVHFAEAEGVAFITTALALRLGHPTSPGLPDALGKTAGDGTPVCPVLQRAGRARRDPTACSITLPLSA
jgi:hypothetical protein